MKAISLIQPWASLIALGHKRIETRSWSTNYSGALAIHASKGFPGWAKAFAAEERELGRLPDKLPRGAIVAVAQLVDVRKTEELALEISGLERRLGDYSFGRFGFVFKEICPLSEPVSCRGALSLWQPDNATFIKVVGRMKEPSTKGGHDEDREKEAR